MHVCRRPYVIQQPIFTGTFNDLRECESHHGWDIRLQSLLQRIEFAHTNAFVAGVLVTRFNNIDLLHNTAHGHVYNILKFHYITLFGIPTQSSMLRLEQAVVHEGGESCVGLGYRSLVIDFRRVQLLDLEYFPAV